MSIHNFHTTKLQFKFQMPKQSGELWENIPSNVETEAFDPNSEKTTLTPKKVETPSNLISKGKATILTGLAMMGTAGAMEIARVKPLESELAKISFESTPIYEDVKNAGKRVSSIIEDPNLLKIHEKGINSYSEITVSPIEYADLSLDKLQKAVGPDYEIKIDDSFGLKGISKVVIKIYKKTNKA